MQILFLKKCAFSDFEDLKLNLQLNLNFCLLFWYIFTTLTEFNLNMFCVTNDATTSKRKHQTIFEKRHNVNTKKLLTFLLFILDWPTCIPQKQEKVWYIYKKCRCCYLQISVHTVYMKKISYFTFILKRPICILESFFGQSFQTDAELRKRN